MLDGPSRGQRWYNRGKIHNQIHSSHLSIIPNFLTKQIDDVEIIIVGTGTLDCIILNRSEQTFALKTQK